MGLSQNGPPAIEFAGLTKRFGTFVAVNRLTFSVPAGSVFGFLGPNGAGKTTTIGMLLGLIEPDEGTATIFGHDVRTDLPAALARTGALVERPSFYPYLSGRTNLRLMARIAGIDDPKRIDAALEMVDLTARANANFGGYSQGMKQRLGIAAALLLEPDLLILDEPTNGLDPAGQHEIRSLIRDLASAGRTIFLSSHLLHEVQEICTHVAIIHRGTLIASGPSGRDPGRRRAAGDPRGSAGGRGGPAAQTPCGPRRRGAGRALAGRRTGGRGGRAQPGARRGGLRRQRPGRPREPVGGALPRADRGAPGGGLRWHRSEPCSASSWPRSFAGR